MGSSANYGSSIWQWYLLSSSRRLRFDEGASEKAIFHKDRYSRVKPRLNRLLHFSKLQLALPSILLAWLLYQNQSHIVDDVTDPFESLEWKGQFAPQWATPADLRYPNMLIWEEIQSKIKLSPRSKIRVHWSFLLKQLSLLLFLFGRQRSQNELQEQYNFFKDWKSSKWYFFLSSEPLFLVTSTYRW